MSEDAANLVNQRIGESAGGGWRDRDCARVRRMVDDAVALFDRLAAEYDGWYQTPLGALADALERQAVFALAGEVAGRR